MTISACNYYNYFIVTSEESVPIIMDNAERELFLYTYAECIVQFFQNYHKRQLPGNLKVF
jgi:hypothetical protein